MRALPPRPSTASRSVTQTGKDGVTAGDGQPAAAKKRKRAPTPFTYYRSPLMPGTCAPTNKKRNGAPVEPGLAARCPCPPWPVVELHFLDTFSRAVTKAFGNTWRLFVSK